MPRKQRFKPSRKPKQDTIPNGPDTATEQINTGQPTDIEVDSGRAQKAEPMIDDTREAG
jgi:hypothetical protein